VTHRVWLRFGFCCVLFAISALAVLREFFIRELIAAFFVFGLAFGNLAVVLLTVALLGYLAETVGVVTWTHMTTFGDAARRAFLAAAAICLGLARGSRGFRSDKWLQGLQPAYRLDPSVRDTNSGRHARVADLLK
jgi:hypothetical protein